MYLCDLTPNGDYGRALTLPGTGVAVVAAAPLASHATRLEATGGHAYAQVTVAGLAVRLTTEAGAPLGGETVRFTSAGGLDLGTAVTGIDGRAERTAQVLVPINLDTGAIDTSKLTGPFTATFAGQPAYQPAEQQAPITLD
ncbi:hypothetical protein [Streptomyces sp. NPDC096033]|uniref:hypothetical protein n=1 Tax=Streptomyces sp. NPDC096033 TaxID=3366071 RepID=UPI00380B8125